MRSWGDIRRLARETRGLLGGRAAGMAAREVLAALIAHWGLTVIHHPPDHPLLNGARAAWREDFGLVVVDATLPETEQLFAIAHELGHRTCHPGSCTCQHDDIAANMLPVAIPLGEGRIWGYNPRQAREIEANIFAAELLAPATELSARFLAGATYRTLVQDYGVTETCMLNQLLGAVLGGVAEEPLSPAAADDSLDLDDSQRRAAEAAELRVLVDAGPGTGKTLALIARAAHLLRTGATADQILILTFSNNAAEEVRERLRGAVPDAASVTVSTFHGFALDTLRRFAAQAGLADDFRVLDDVDAAMLLERALPDLDLRHYAHLARPDLYFPALLSACSRMRDRVLTPEDLAAQAPPGGRTEASDPADEPLAETLRLLAAYERLLAEHNLVDYGGLITRAIRLLQGMPEVAAALRRQFRHILVDEYQDVNRASAILLRELVDGATGLWVVGDVRQAIFRFRGAEPENVLAFERDFPGAVRLTLDVNYRSVPALVATFVGAAERITGASPPWRAVRDECADGGTVFVLAADGAAEHAGVAADIARSIAAGRAPQDHAVLCCTHAQAAAVSAALERAGFTTTYLGDFLTRPEIKDMLALLEWCGGGDGAALLRLATWPEYAADAGRVESLLRAARERELRFPAALGDASLLAPLPPAEREGLSRLSTHTEAIRYYPDPADILLRYLFGEAGYLRSLLRNGSPAGKQRASALFQLVVLARGFVSRPLTEPDGALPRAFLRYVRRLLAGREKAVFQATAPVPGAVNVLTVHASKGLEFPVVYVPNLSQGRFPSRAPRGAQIALPGSLEQEEGHDEGDSRNLFFVALSRARDRLVVSRARVYDGRGSTESPLRSIFQGLPGVTRAEWPGEKRAALAAPPLGTGGAVIRDHELEAVLRCPLQHYYRHQLGLRGSDDDRGYLHFVRLLRAGLRWLREARASRDWPPSWEAAEAALRSWWDANWPAEYPLRVFYGRAALRAYAREYAAAATGETAPAVLRGVQRIVEADGHQVLVEIDCVEERDDDTWFIWERASAVDEDQQSLHMALYGAAAKADGARGPVTVAIRYLDSGATERLPQASRLLDRHRDRDRIPVVIDQVQGGEFSPSPRSAAECTRCPFVFICPR